jgi:hypothetical protein
MPTDNSSAGIGLEVVADLARSAGARAVRALLKAAGDALYCPRLGSVVQEVAAMTGRDLVPLRFA